MSTLSPLAVRSEPNDQDGRILIYCNCQESCRSDLAGWLDQGASWSESALNRILVDLG